MSVTAQPLGSSTLQYALKTLWPQSRVYNTVYSAHPFLAMIPKNEEFYGDSMYIAVRYADSQGRAAAFGTAQTLSQSTVTGAHKGMRFQITRVRDYQVVALETEAILAAKRDVGSLIRSLDTEIGTGVNNLSKSLATALFRGRAGNIGQVSSSVAITATTITLQNANDVTSFEVGMVLVAASSIASGTANRTTPATAQITGVDRDAGVLTFGAGTFTGTNWAASDFLFAQGDSVAGGTTFQKVFGLADWLPSTAPTTGDAVFGAQADRSVDPTRLAGIRIDASALSPEEAAARSLVRLSREGGNPDYMVANHQDWQNISTSLGSKVETSYTSTGEFGFEALRIRGPRGLCSIVADQDCPQGRGYLLQMDTWKLYSLEGCPQILNMDGNQLSRVYNADQFEARIVYYANTACTAPGFNATVNMPQ